MELLGESGRISEGLVLQFGSLLADGGDVAVKQVEEGLHKLPVGRVLLVLFELAQHH